MSDSSEKSDTGTAAGRPNSLGLKAFNQTGREDTTHEVLRPKVDPGVRRRNAMLVAAVIAAAAIATFVAYQRSGLSLIPRGDETGASFGTAGRDAMSRENPEASDKSQ
jgi:hypothetical protein